MGFDECVMFYRYHISCLSSVLGSEKPLGVETEGSGTWPQISCGGQVKVGARTAVTSAPARAGAGGVEGCPSALPRRPPGRPPAPTSGHWVRSPQNRGERTQLAGAESVTLGRAGRPRPPWAEGLTQGLGFGPRLRCEPGPFSWPHGGRTEPRFSPAPARLQAPVPRLPSLARRRDKPATDLRSASSSVKHSTAPGIT